MRKTYILILSLVIGVAVTVWLKVNSKSTQPIACTMEAKLCPDGGAVGRTGPNCEFAECPVAVTPLVLTSTISGTVTLSPICPVERMPPEPQCAPKPYQTKIEVFSADGSKLIKSTQAGSDGSFTLALPFGNYTIQAGTGAVHPSCSPVAVLLQTATALVDISCDTGIR